MGIGKNNPQTSLDVVGTATITNQTDGAVLLDLNSERNWQFKQLGTGAASSLELASINGGGNKNFVINTLGNVGVGTQTPQKKLDVSGNRADLLLKTTQSSAMNGDVLSSILFLLAASSIKSIALSGSFLLVIYLADSFEAVMTALSEILIP